MTDCRWLPSAGPPIDFLVAVRPSVCTTSSSRSEFWTHNMAVLCALGRSQMIDDYQRYLQLTTINVWNKWVDPDSILQTQIYVVNISIHIDGHLYTPVHMHINCIKSQAVQKTGYLMYLILYILRAHKIPNSYLESTKLYLALSPNQTFMYPKWRFGG